MAIKVKAERLPDSSWEIKVTGIDPEKPQSEKQLISAMIQACKDAGMTEEELHNLKIKGH